MSAKLPPPQYYRLDDTCLVIDCQHINQLDHKQKQRLINYVAMQCHARHEVVDAVSADESLTLYCELGTDLSTLERQCTDLWSGFDDGHLVSRHHLIPVRYGADHGIDLARVAEQCNLTERQVIDAHCASKYDVDFLGFQPGFAYISGLDSRLHLPRLATPRTLVPKGSVAIAGDKTAIYPANSPGGWHIIGHTELTLFDPLSQPPALFAPGDTLSFTEA
ncbi:5-oxoprolinase subunit PxpB [Pseudoalteromonas sp. BDTF-M6]|uniref:5-oxoprolinase subunit PxpB n=1 Tax=Pseudoalteromonas sp. BDTF-M6 TaxID=2796132 RepID=UPI001BB0AA9C|nr:5-oxoprolinase subunit PxpB [Pseudoalteromonas sp. BDTF-M6]MBS3796608.1 5-oxoprolinase subunit PxpB [Pseudoalteromonas sp. BDTF-M6]